MTISTLHGPYRPRQARDTAFVWKISCRSGVLVRGKHSDFLVAVFMAKQQKARWLSLLPSSTLRVQLLYPNGQRVSPADIKAAVKALVDTRVSESVVSRLAAAAAAAAAVPPAAQARTERTVAAGAAAACAPQVFRQAGVVAPPDSPDFGKRRSGASILRKC